MGNKNDKIDYELEELDNSEYELKIMLDAKDAILLKIFKAAKRKIKRMRQIDIKGDPSLIKDFMVPAELRSKFLPIVNIRIRKLMLQLKQFFYEEDKFKITSWKCVNIIFKRKGDNDWKICLVIRGLFVWDW